MQAEGPRLWNVKGLYHYSWQRLICSLQVNHRKLQGLAFTPSFQCPRGVNGAAAARAGERPNDGKAKILQPGWMLSGGGSRLLLLTGSSDSQKAALSVTKALLSTCGLHKRVMIIIKPNRSCRRSSSDLPHGCCRITSARLDFCNCEISSRLTWYFCPINFIMFPGMKELRDKPNPPFSCVWPPAFGNFMPFSEEIIFITTLWCHKAADCHAWGLSLKSLLYILTHDGYNGQIMCFPF